MKKYSYFLFIILYIFALFFPTNNLAGDNTESSANNTESSIVKIQTDKGIGTGFYVHNNILATNFHVIEGANKVLVLADKSNAVAVEWVIGYDKITDLALLFIPHIGTPLPIAVKGLNYGTPLNSSGYPLGGERYSFNAIFTGWEKFDDILYLKLNAIIIPGMSGGPVLNQFGEVVAINRLGNYNPWSQELVAPSACYLQELLEQGLKKDFTQYIPLATFAKNTQQYLHIEKKHDEIIITEN